MRAKLNNIRNKKILVVGDIMLDTYHIGDVKRISPEAPVPVVKINNTYSVLGGAANVARNLLGLGCKPHVIGLIGRDSSGEKVCTLFNELGVDVSIEYSKYPTITKTRIIGNDQQIVRIDFEDDKLMLTDENETNIISKSRSIISEMDIVIISDYGKGLCNKNICKQIIDMAKEHGKTIIVDPKGVDWEKYSGATIITPNIKELSDISTVEITNEDKVIEVEAEKIVEKYAVDSLLVTRSEKGMSYVNSEICRHIPTDAREVFDVSGAGDTVVATLAAALSADFSIIDSMYIANKAAGVVVAKLGTSPILFKELQSVLMIRSFNEKIVAKEQLDNLLQFLKLQNSKIVFTNGCFDILHRGHVSYLEEARKLGDVLIVGLNSDASVKRLKGESRPINDEESRSVILAALKVVDYIILFEEDTPLELIKSIEPDILVKGGDYAIENIVGRQYARECVTIPFVEGFSSTKIIENM